ncbi:MAG: hypothetical protein Q9161_000693 [Pseudevernia consocians]
MAGFVTSTATSNPTAALTDRPSNPHTHVSVASSPKLPSLPHAVDFAIPQGNRKRRRSLKLASASATGPEAKLSKGSNTSKSTLSPEYTPKVFTGTAALVDEQRERDRIEGRQTSPNPARKALGHLLGSQASGMTRLQDAPKEASTLSRPLPEVAPSMKLPITGALVASSGATVQTSPQTTASFAISGSTAAPTITANGTSVASPGQIDDVAGEDDDGDDDDDDGDDDGQGQSENGQGRGDAGGTDPEEGRSNKAFTYPGPMLAVQAHRTSSLPQSGYGSGRANTRSPSTKRHKCPYCSTDFTRHHNLKSHLLTHSHEKPYQCDTCEARFRRLHDLKRHTKLHTGERPHVCPKCDRSFARGDALARHNKGQGGCAGRRSSMGSFGGDEKHEEKMRAGDGDSMPGIMYTAEASHEPEHMDEDTDSPSGRSLPSIRQHDAPPDEHHGHVSEHQTMYQSRQPSTYPPVAARQPTGGLYPPPNASPRGGSGPPSTQSSLGLSSYPPPPPPPPGSGISAGFQAAGPNAFAHGGMTESPKPLSPAGITSHQPSHSDAGIHRNRSPSLTQQFQSTQFGRRTTGHNISPPMNLPPPNPGAGHPNVPQLPSLPGLNPPETRYTLHSQTTGPTQPHAGVPNSLPGPPTHGPSSPNYPPVTTSSANNSLSSHGSGPQTSFDRHHSLYAPSNEQLWTCVRSLEVKIERLQDEVALLKSQPSRGSHEHH